MNKQTQMPSPDHQPATVMLLGSVEVSTEVLGLALRMEAIGAGLRIDPDDATALLVDRAQLLSDDDITLLRRHKAGLLRLITYVAPTVS